MWQVLAILLDIILWVLVKTARWKKLSSATNEDTVEMAKSGQSILDIARVLYEWSQCPQNYNLKTASKDLDEASNLEL